MQRSLVGVFGERLNDANCQPIFRAIKAKNFLSVGATLFLFPLKDFFDARMLDYGNTLIVVEEPLNHVGNRINVDAPLRVAQQWRSFRSSFSAVISSAYH